MGISYKRRIFVSIYYKLLDVLQYFLRFILQAYNL